MVGDQSDGSLGVVGRNAWQLPTICAKVGQKSWALKLGRATGLARARRDGVDTLLAAAIRARWTVFGVAGGGCGWS